MRVPVGVPRVRRPSGRRGAWRSAMVVAAMGAGCVHAGLEAPVPASVSADVLMEADRAFAADVAVGGSEVWASWFDPDGAMIQPGIGEVRGLPDIESLMGVLDAPGVALAWEPARAQIAASGDLGWTTGSFVSRAPGPDGVDVEGRGRYVTIWRLQADGSWKVVMDLGNPSDVPPE
jgi:ketosteroid isomerase-like protein